MDTLYTARLHGFPDLSKGTGMEPALTEEGILSLLIVLGSSISLVGLVFAFITYSLFSDLRNLSGTALMNLLAALFMTQLLYVVGVGGVPDPELCISLAFSLQYVRLCVLCWLIVITHHMCQQFTSHMHSLIPQPDASIGKHFFRYSLFAWGLPALLLAFSVLIQYSEKSHNLLDTSSLTPHNCWFLDMWAFTSCFLLPCAIFFLATLFYIVNCVAAVYKAVSVQLDRKVREKMLKKRKLQIVLFFKITLVVNGVVILGGTYRLSNSDWSRIIYHIVQGLQGIVVAVLVTCNCQILKLYSKSIKKSKRQIPHFYGGSDAKSLSKSTSLQLLTWEPPPDIV